MWIAVALLGKDLVDPFENGIPFLDLEFGVQRDVEECDAVVFRHEETAIQGVCLDPLLECFLLLRVFGHGANKGCRQ